MSTATATDATAPPAKGKKKLIIIVAAVLLVVAGGGGAAVVMMKKKAAAEAEAAAAEEGEDGKTAKVAKTVKAAKKDPAAAPIFVPLDMFTVNLADRTAERYAQIGITLEIEDAKLGDQLKNYMPAVRNNILMLIADKTAEQLMDREGKARLALQVRRETSRALGFEVPEEEAEEEAAADDKATRKKRKPKADPNAGLPITAVHFSNFIIQ
jgi:flagellar protein FliL